MKVNGDKVPVKLNAHLNLSDFLGLAEQHYGRGCTRATALAFTVQGKSLSVHDETKSNQQKSSIRPQCCIFTVRRRIDDDGCFLADTSIHLADFSTIPVSEVSFCDALLAVNSFSEIVRTVVQNISKHEVHQYLVVTLANGTKLRVTREHSFLIENRTFKSIGDLQAGSLDTPYAYFVGRNPVHDKPRTAPIGVSLTVSQSREFVVSDDTPGTLQMRWDFDAPD